LLSAFLWFILPSFHAHSRCVLLSHFPISLLSALCFPLSALCYPLPHLSAHTYQVCDSFAPPHLSGREHTRYSIKSSTIS
jgi:hypothetical protein